MTRKEIKELIAARPTYAKFALALAVGEEIENSPRSLFHDPKWQAVYDQAREDIKKLYKKE